MKKLFNEIAYYALLIPAGMVYFLVDTFRAKEKESEIRHARKKTVYPIDAPESEKEWFDYMFTMAKEKNHPNIK